MLKQLIKKIFALAGLEIRRIDKSTDLPVYYRLYGRQAVQEKRFYNMGQRTFFHPAWTILDNFREKDGIIRLPGDYAIHHDLMSLKPLPLPDNSAVLMYTSHTLEHVSNPAVETFLSESFRVLKPGGILRVVVPDIKLSFRAWQNNDRDFFFWADSAYVYDDWHCYNLRMPLHQASLTQIFLEDFASTASELTVEGAAQRISDREMEHLFSTLPMEEALNYCIARCPLELQQRYPFHHMNWFTEEKLADLLQRAGFTRVYTSRWGQSQSPVMRNTRFFDTTTPKVSLYMEAMK